MIDVVCTTISDGSFLKHWQRAIERDDLGDEVRLVIIPDRKTPRSLYGHAAALREAGLKVACPTVAEQDEFLRKLGAKPEFIPHDSDNRRNVGYLMSWQCADMLISVDDDNVPFDDSYFGGHSVVLELPARHFGLSTSTSWLNVMDELDTRPAGRYWPRGFPYFARESCRKIETWDEVEVSINQGLWLGDPDVDAITRIGAAPVSYAFSGRSSVLAAGTWAPVNSQNTAIRRDVIPAYYFAKMPSWGGRFGDIFQGYFAEKCAKRMGHAVRVGTPLVRQDRNAHDLFRDLDLELPFIKLMERVLEWLPEVDLGGSTYRDVYESLSHALDDAAESFRAQEAAHRHYLHRLAHHMRCWLGLCNNIGRF